MKRALGIAISFSLFVGSSFAITKDEAAKKIKEYISGMKAVSEEITICENEKYYIGEVFLKGYENFDVVRKIYINKKTGDLLPSFAEAFDYCYMMK
ncbi:MAG: hypothetical protein GXO21_01310 [Aquificae bacterium]|nr:hypothetical protein [Aquificota bacterium]